MQMAGRHPFHPQLQLGAMRLAVPRPNMMPLQMRNQRPNIPMAAPFPVRPGPPIPNYGLHLRPVVSNLALTNKRLCFHPF